MKYRNEKEIIIDQLETLIARGLNTSFPTSARLEGNQLLSADMKLLSSDPEIARLFLARQVLIGENSQENTSAAQNNGKLSDSKELSVTPSLVDEFKKAFDFLCSLRNEKDHGKAILGLIEIGIFLITIVTALSANEASRNNKPHS